MEVSGKTTAMANITTVPSTLASTTIPDLPIILPANLARSAYNLLALYTGFLTFVGIFNNGLVIFLFLKFQNLRQPVNYFLLNLSISDMTVSLLASPLTFASNIAGYWLFGQLGCSVYAFVVMIGGFEQIVALAAVSVHRCFLVVRPFTAKKMTSNWAIFFVSLTWLYSFILSIPPAFGWNEYVPEGAGTACAINWTDTKPGNTSYVIFIFIMVLLVPLMIIIFSYGLLIFAVKKISASEAAQSTENKAEGRVTKMVVVMIFFFMFAWTPYSVFALYVVFVGTHTVSPLLATMPAFFAKACTIYNPVLYFVLNRQFRDAFYELIGYQPADPLENSGNRNQGGNASQQQNPTSNRQSVQRSASVATVMSELPSVRHDTLRAPGQFLAGGRVDPTARALSKSYKKSSGTEDQERLGVTSLPGQSVEMTDSLKALNGSDETNPAGEKDKGGHVNEGYDGQEGGEMKTVYVQRVQVRSANNDDDASSVRQRKEPSGMTDVNV